MTDNRYFTSKLNNEQYPIVVGKSAFTELCRYLQGCNKSILIVYDEVLPEMRYDSINLHDLLRHYESMPIAGGLSSKTYKTMFKVIDRLVQCNFTRDSVLVAIGGGVIGDVVALAASLFMRGAGLIHVPTITTAMIDSSLGGKTGINYSNQVNLLGTYYNPMAIFMDLGFFSSLSDRDYKAGICEAIKMGITSNIELFNFLQSNSTKVMARDFDSIHRVVEMSIVTKLMHVRDDMMEKSKRLILNYGHTFGQAIESYYKLDNDSVLHGEAVALGMVVAAQMACYHFNSSESLKTSILIKEILKLYDLPTHILDLNCQKVASPRELILNLKNDKKRTNNGDRFILTHGLGDAHIVSINQQNQDDLLASYKVICE